MPRIDINGGRQVSTKTRGHGIPVGGWRYVLCSACGRVVRGGRLARGGVMLRPHGTPGRRGLGHDCPGHVRNDHQLLTPLYHELCNRLACLYRGELWDGSLDPATMVPAYGYGHLEGPVLRCGQCAIAIVDKSDLSLRVDSTR